MTASRTNLLLCSIAILTLASCAHYPDVRPGDNGQHKVILNVESKEEGYRQAMSQAKDYCKEEESGKKAFIMTENSKYQGTMDESTYNKGKTASKVAQAVGGTVWAMGGQTESNAGGVVGLGGSAARGALGNGYQYILNFRCK